MQIVYYTWLALAAVYILSKEATATGNHRAFLTMGVIVVGVLSITMVLSFHNAMGRMRHRLRYIYETYFDAVQRRGLFLDPGRRFYITTLMVGACIIPAIFTLTLLW